MITHHGGSLIKGAVVMSAPGTRCCRHGRTRAQILKAEATGPSVPAIMGKADEANHQRLRELAGLVSVILSSSLWPVGDMTYEGSR